MTWLFDKKSIFLVSIPRGARPEADARPGTWHENEDEKMSLGFGGTKFKVWGLGFRAEGQGGLVSRIRMWIIRVTIWVIGVLNLLTHSP